MINLEAVESEIEELKACKQLTYSQTKYLSWLCIIRNSLLEEQRPSRAHTSEFLELASAIHPELLLAIFDEHMDVLKIVHKGEYLSIMDRLRELKERRATH